MKRCFPIIALALCATSFAQYQSQGVRFLSQIALNQFPGSPTIGSAIYGYTSPSGREYATIGLKTGESVVDITNPAAPVQINYINGPSSDWHENVVMGPYCYAVTDSGGAVGVRIIDLTNVDNGQAPMVATYNGGTTAPLSNVHTIQGDAATQRLFCNGSNRGMAILDASNPTSLVEVGRWHSSIYPGARYVHDSLVKNYTSGPWAGKQIVFAFCGTSGLYILDTTNPANIITLGSTPIYPGGGNSTYCHSGVLTPDNNHVLINDEFDERQNLTGSCTTVIIDVSNLATPTKVGQFASGVNTIDHNSQLKNGYLYLSAYEAGVRIYNASNPLGMSESGWFDTYPSSTSDATYNGNWGVYAMYPSGNIALSDRQRGLFVLDPSEAIGCGAPILSATGSIESGGVPDARKSDDTFLKIGRISRGLGNIDFILQTTYSPLVSLDFTMEGRGSGVMRGYLKNLTTGQWDLITAGIVNSVSDRTLTVTGLNPALYVTTTGQIEARANVLFQPTSSRPYLDLDMIQVKANR